MTRIRILDEDTANKIAAGEVIERPASVVKELVENAIDAGSTRIRISIEEGGIKKIQVRDDGSGMSREDCQLAFSRHGTSKIKHAGDLLRIRTLGFRGEALPSIAAVSRVTLMSRQREDLEGTVIRLEGGKLAGITPAGCPAGTEVIVEDLFFNTPARKKYLKRPATEAFHAIAAVQKLAVAHPAVGFQLWHNGQQVLATGGSGVLQNALVDLFGLEFVENLVPVNWKNEVIEITGYAGKGFFSRSNRDQQFFIVNGRAVRSPLLQGAVERVYRGLLPNGRYPVAVISLRVDPEEVDVNVHPAKLEIKFADPDRISQALTGAVHRALQETNHIPLVTGSGAPVQEVTKRIERVKEAVDTYLQTQLKDYQIEHTAETPAGSLRGPLGAREHSEVPQGTVDPVAAPAPAGRVEQEPFPELVAIGQLHDSFILAQGAEGLYIVDQHAAHERIEYEALWDKMGTSACEAQGLAVPVTLELNPVDKELLINRMVLLRDMGIIIEHFGKNTFLIRAVPLGFTGEEIAELIWEIIHTEKQPGHKTQDAREPVIKMLACKKAVKAKQRLSQVEQQALLDKLARLNRPFTCPHGRPVIICLSMKELLRRFGRS
ncbi:MAG TPA: DNA mismatch repair endonuclease MutL [Clostridia bacterium]|nr:DNA mismatch repair endonuclease MutL [Clostridia bacterium]